MIKRFYWNSDLDEDSFYNFITFQNELKEGDKLEVWLDSRGGLCVVAEMLKELFESYAEEDFQLVASGEIYSSAFDLFVGVKCKKYVVPGTMGMIHTTSKRVSIRPVKGHIKLKFSEDKLLNIKFPLVQYVENLIPKVLTKKEIKMYENDEDIFLTTEEIKKFLT